ncbi:MAG TPA: pyridoxal phosphate-dependent aminotransferase [Bacteroidaceae bacterium]|nr:pyridoxal phosphate-dependent aminotransferase [Bacteroidaceae bacterium]
MGQISERVNRLASSATFAMAQKSGALSAQGVDVVNMSVGEPDFNTPDNVKKAAKYAIDENYSKYSPVSGFISLRKAIVEKLKRENELDYSLSNILVSTGAKQSLCNVLMALINPGDEVVIPSPYWVSYPDMVKLVDGTPVFVKAGIEQDFKITANQLEKAITPATKAIMICSPSNPTGSVYSKKELELLAEVIEKYPNVYVIADEIYEHINFVGKHESLAQFHSIKERVIVVNGVSKAYAMTGWRIGFMAGPEWLVKACDKLQGQYTSGTCSVAQKAAEEAFLGPQEDVEKMRRIFQQRRDLIVSLAKEIPGFEVNTPQGAFYLFPKCDYYFGKSFEGFVINDSDDLAMYLLETGHVAAVGGTSFGASECIRFSFATSEERIKEAFQRINKSLARLE